MRMFKLTIAIIFSLITESGVVHGQLKNEAAFVAAINNAFSNKDTTGVSLYLSSEFSIAGDTGLAAKFRLDQILKKEWGLSMRLLGKKESKKGAIYEIEFTDSQKRKSTSIASINFEGELLSFSLFDELYGLRRDKQSKLVARIPFENINGSIILQVYINEFSRPLRLLFDTGADGMAVSQSLADEIGLKITRENNATVVGGMSKIQVSDNNSIRLDTLNMKGMGIAVFQEKASDHADGIIGNTLMKRYITHIDYDKNILSLYSFGPHKYEGKGQTVNLKMHSGIMTLAGELQIVQDKKCAGQFFFDTGASYGLICFRQFVRKNKLLVSGFKSDMQASIISMGVSTPTFTGKSHSFAMNGLNSIPNFPVSLMGGSPYNENWDPGTDGSIGVRLLSRYNITINLGEGEFFFSPNKLYNLPQDFILKNHQFGWNNKGKLTVLGATGSDERLKGLEEGIELISIEGFSPEELSEDTELIPHIQINAISKNIVLGLKDGRKISL